MKKILKLIAPVLVLFWLNGCGDSLPIEQDLSNKNYKLLNQDSVEVVYPEVVKGSVAVIGYVFTNCPDICPLTTNNMRLIQKNVEEEELSNVEFVTISFDPEYDTPSVLKKYSEVRNLDTSNWMFLTGDKKTTDKVINDVGVVAAVSDSTEMENGNQMYFYVHTDRINLMDKQGRIRGSYLGSKANIDKIVEDIKILSN